MVYVIKNFETMQWYFEILKAIHVLKCSYQYIQKKISDYFMKNRRQRIQG